MSPLEIYSKQKAFFSTNKTKDVDFRITQLKKLRSLLKENEALLFKAIYEDFRKSEFETYITELSLLYHELNLFVKNIKKWSKRKRVTTGIANFPASSYMIPEPLGVTLIIGAWNYPYQLSLVPAITSLAAGNTVILKPSELPSRSSAIMAKLINDHFPAEYFCVIEGGVNETTELLAYRFDKIFFTGSIPVGKAIYQAAAKHLTPVTLELGGKSPAFVLADADISIAAKRIIWSKFLNAGQTCVAPDYVLVDQAIETKFLEALQSELERHHQKNANGISENYVQIINEKNFDRLHRLIDPSKVYYGGQTNRQERFISPTLLKNVSFEDEVMQDEIFGPILPVIAFADLNQTIQQVKEQPKPLSCYIYSNNKRLTDKLLNEISFGGGGVNDSLLHLTNTNLPFGGVGFSGIGSYHGKFGFDTFTHYKSILDRPLWYEFNKNPPYSNFKLRLIKFLLG